MVEDTKAEEGVKMVEDAKEVENTVKAKKDSWGYEKCDDRDNKECEDRDHRECDIRCIEISDGGEGTAATLTRVLGGDVVKAIVSDPLGRKIEATYGIATISGQKTAIMEMAQASGLTLLKPSERNPLLTSTYGTGEMILDALNRGCKKFLIGIGGSATNDGGTGMLEALGFKFIDSNGRGMTGMCGGNINRIARIVPPLLLEEAEFIIACDVDTPFCGREGAAEVFGPQKGATPEEVVLLEDGMQSLNNIIKRDYGIDLSSIKGTGAAGGLGGAFHAFLDGRLQSGIGMVLDAIGFEEQIKDADLIITGEGRIDSQTCRGKVISGITSVAAKHGVPVIAIAGIVDMGEKEIEEAGLKAAFPIGPRPQNESDLEYAMRPEVASKNISETVSKALASLFPSSFRGNL
jgi:glycerate kinase